MPAGLPHRLPPAAAGPAAAAFAVVALLIDVPAGLTLGLTDDGGFMAVDATVTQGAALEVINARLLVLQVVELPPSQIATTQAVLNGAVLARLTQIDLALAAMGAVATEATAMAMPLVSGGADRHGNQKSGYAEGKLVHGIDLSLFDLVGGDREEPGLYPTFETENAKPALNPI